MIEASKTRIHSRSSESHTKRTLRLPQNPRKENDERDATKDTKVKPCADAPQHKGLFATHPIKKGHIVAKFNKLRKLDPKVGTDRVLIAKHKASDVDGDQTIQIDNTFVTDTGFKFDERGIATRAPRWYRMNNANDSNATATFDMQEKHWIARRDLKAGEPITWFYGEVPAQWRTDAFCTAARDTKERGRRGGEEREGREKGERRERERREKGERREREERRKKKKRGGARPSPSD